MKKNLSILTKKQIHWFLRHFITILSCVLIIVLGIAALTKATTIGNDISTVNFTASGNATTTGTHYIGSDLTVIGNASTTGTFNLSGLATFLSGLTITGNTTSTGNFNISGTTTLATTTVSGDLAVQGEVKADSAVKDVNGWIENKARQNITDSANSDSYPVGNNIRIAGAKSIDCSTINANCAYLQGGADDGRYTYLINTQATYIIRIDNTKDVDDTTAWVFKDYSGVLNQANMWGTIFVGNRYIIVFPDHQADGKFLIYDTTLDFTSDSSFSTVDVNSLGADGVRGATELGKYVYFAPHRVDGTTWNSKFVRWDVSTGFAGFSVAANWKVYDANPTDSLTPYGFLGMGKDDRYLYATPYAGGTNPIFLKYDTYNDSAFNTSGNWQAIDLNTCFPGEAGWHNAGFDGVFMHYAGYGGSGSPVYRGVHVAYDTRKDFKKCTSWRKLDIADFGGVSNDYVGYWSIGIIGNLVMYTPWLNNSAYHGNLAFYDFTKDYSDGNAWDIFDVSSLASCAGGCVGFQSYSYSHGKLNLFSEQTSYALQIDISFPSAIQATNGSRINASDELVFQQMVDYFKDVTGTNLKLLLGWFTPSDGGTETDYSGQGNDFTYAAASDFTFDQKKSLGMGWVLDFDGVDDYLSRADSGAGDDFTFGDGTNDNDFTIEAVVEVVSGIDTQAIITKHNAQTPVKEYRFAINSSEQVQFDATDDSVPITNTCVTPVISTGLHHVAVTFDDALGAGGSCEGTDWCWNGTDGCLKIYVDGVSQALTATEDATYVAMEDTVADILIGAQIAWTGSVNWFFDGYMSPPRVIKGQALSEQEVWEHYLDAKWIYGL